MSVSWIAVGRVIGLFRGRIADMFWLLRQLKNASKIRMVVEAKEKGIPICPKCHIPTQFERQESHGQEFDLQFVRWYKCPHCVLEIPVRWTA